MDNIINTNEIDITKITFSGSNDLINRFNKYIRENIKDYKTHIGKTTFPKKEENNYRMDFTRYAFKR